MMGEGGGRTCSRAGRMWMYASTFLEVDIDMEDKLRELCDVTTWSVAVAMFAFQID